MPGCSMLTCYKSWWTLGLPGWWYARGTCKPIISSHWQWLCTHNKIDYIPNVVPLANACHLHYGSNMWCEVVYHRVVVCHIIASDKSDLHSYEWAKHVWTTWMVVRYLVFDFELSCNLEECMAKSLAVMQTIHMNKTKEWWPNCPLCVSSWVSQLLFDPVPCHRKVTIGVLHLPHITCQVNLPLDGCALQKYDEFQIDDNRWKHPTLSHLESAVTLRLNSCKIPSQVLQRLSIFMPFVAQAATWIISWNNGYCNTCSGYEDCVKYMLPSGGWVVMYLVHGNKLVVSDLIKQCVWIWYDLLLLLHVWVECCLLALPLSVLLP